MQKLQKYLLWIWVKSVRFALNAVKAVKNISQRYQQNAVTKLSPLKLQTIQIFPANIKDSLNFTGNIDEVSNRWRSGITSWSHAGGEWFEPFYGKFYSVKNPVNAVKKHFSPLKTSNLTKIHRFHRIQRLKMRALTVKKFFSAAIFRQSYIFWQNLHPGY